MNAWFNCADKGATEQMFPVFGHEYFFAISFVTSSGCVFCKGRAEEEKLENVG
jgi:hypothetical protein